ncbi:ATP-binding cassette domain-containing protein [Pedosphaera parvula]|uniref:ABC transporter related-protein n=1 Tax=Pedosphaera parvula (strain Ellin514) TaxID=320771 RepID=B9XRL6_PEDPL|nr:ATP-binding cassette domain-containing protein [Pedosphaera parvula]EEF57535.1 ABC transporter related-protein [Pedosphaera parvula Ellin514]
MPDAANQANMKLLLKNIRLPVTGFDVMVDVELPQQVTAIFGPSGAGKTSLLDLIAGLRRPQSAFIQLQDDVLVDTNRRISVPSQLRHIGYVPQDLALFPHLSVRQNLLYGHKQESETNPVFSFDHVTEVLAIQTLTQRRVTDLSGGEKQRVALARALLSCPRLLLLDEPLANLDAGLKAKIIPYLARIKEEFHLPMLYITHDRMEVVALCDEVLEMSRGRIIRQSSIPDWNAPPAI